MSCEENSEPIVIEEVETVPPPARDPQVVKDSIEKVKLDSTTAVYMKTFNLVDILSVDPTIKVDLRYATDNNFMGEVLYDTLNVLYLQADVAERIAKCQSYLKEKHPTLSLIHISEPTRL